MPYPRFNKLAVEKRTQLLESAAQEFARYGFADASVNRILDKAHMSKGAAYYYFEDKVDLFCTVIQYAMERLKLVDTQLDVATLTPETFWPTVATAHREPCCARSNSPGFSRLSVQRVNCLRMPASKSRWPLLRSTLFPMRCHV